VNQETCAEKEDNLIMLKFSYNLGNSMKMVTM